MKGVKILKEDDKVTCFEVLFIEVGSFNFCHAEYDSEESRDAAYEYVLNKINEYLFPQIESYKPGGDETLVQRLL